MKTRRETSFSSALILVFMTFASFSWNFVVAQSTGDDTGQNRNSAETLAEASTPLVNSATEESKMVDPKFDRSDVYQDIQGYLIDEMVFPTEGIETGQSGMVKVQFQIATDGSMHQFKFIESPGPSFENQVIEALSNAPKWTPARKDGNNIAITYQLNIDFTLQ